MSDTAIRVEKLSKQYRIGGKQAGYRTIRESVTEAVQAPLRRLRSTFQRSNVQHPNANTIWALRDVSFEVQRGEVVGIIGRNGAGKTTLLKILSRITEPTEGRAEIHGRVGSLLEVGTGFHPELTGRENIYLNGAILGMRRQEIEHKFDEIVDFSGVEKFIDTPVKRYSSGMHVRLAFAVAAHLEPQILLIDEVLAVGDVEFRKKCLGKMGDVAREGRTVLFVSHNMGTIRSLCARAILLESGELREDGEAFKVVQLYLSEGMENGCAKLAWDGSLDAQFLSISVMNESGAVTQMFDFNERVRLDIELEVRKPIPSPYLTVSIHTTLGVSVLFSDRIDDVAEHLSSPGVYRIQVLLPGALLAPDEYMVNLGISSSSEHRVVHNPHSVTSFQIMPLKGHRSGIPAIIYADFDYKVETCS